MKNIGGQPLSYTGTPVVGGTNAANFSIFSINPIVTSIAAGDSVAVTIRFTPSSTGLRTANISIPTNDPLTNNYVLNLNGTGTAPDIDVKQNGTGIANAGNFSFGSINTSSFSDKIFDIKNTGNDTLFLTNSSFSGTNAADFSFQSSTTATIAPNATYNLTIRCTPGASGSRTAKCTLTSNDPDENPFEINLSATGSTAIIGVKQSTTTIANAGNFSFGTSIINTGNSKTFTIENTGSDTLKFTGSSITGTNSADFTTATNFNTLTVAPSSNANFSITFTPTSIGNKTASISLSNNDVGNNPFVINLSGNGDSASDIHVQQSGSDYLNNSIFNYGNKLNGANHDVIFSVQNVQGVPLVVSSVTLTGTNASEFQIMPPVPTTVAKGSPSNCTVRFKPLTLGSKTANLVITSSDPDESPYTIVLNGNSVTPEINIKQGLTNINAGGSYNYSNTPINFDNDIVFTIENTGTDALSGILGTIIGANASDFVIINPPAISINASATTTITVRFRPTVAGARTATLNLSSNDADENPYLITLNGTGINLPAPNIDLSQAAVQITNNASYAFGAVATGGNIPVTFTITNSGDDTLRNILAKLSGTNVSEFKFTSQPAFKLDPGATTDFIITFSPLSASSRSAILKISSNDLDENPFTVNLTGSGNGPEIDVTSNNIPNPNNSTQPFPLTKTWASSPITFVIANKGNAILNNITVAILGKIPLTF
ncbi:MAG: choice-of-anchor D domain-containing protein [Bacteroidetes bacterium]|nr:choice-of-anchor D domain-containing protein [Bacteroidota bacterium]